MPPPCRFRWFPQAKPVIGMVHAPPLPGSPGFCGDSSSILTSVLKDAEAWCEGGVHALMLENFGDTPFFPRRVPAHCLTQLTVLAVEMLRRFDIPLGINVLRNDGLGALSIAHAVGAAFIRVNVLCGARVADQGVLVGIAHQLLRERQALNATDAAGKIDILADVDVKHSAPLAPRPLAEEVNETIHRGGADAVIVSGSGTGQPTDVESVQAAKSAAGETPVLVGSGVTLATLDGLFSTADGFIVGTSLKRDGIATNPVDPNRVQEFMRQYASLAAYESSLPN